MDRNCTESHACVSNPSPALLSMVQGDWRNIIMTRVGLTHWRFSGVARILGRAGLKSAEQGQSITPKKRSSLFLSSQHAQ